MEQDNKINNILLEILKDMNQLSLRLRQEEGQYIFVSIFKCGDPSSRRGQRVN